MKAIVRYIDVKKGFECKEIPIPKVIPGYVLVKVMAAPIDPIDEFILTGDLTAYPMKFVEPICCGSEGSGLVTEIGPGVPPEYKGKKVVVERGLKLTSESVGMWCQYALMPYENCIIVDDSFQYDDVAGLMINPLTVLGMLDKIKAAGTKAIVFTAAASAIGKNMLAACKKEGVEMICVVRKKEHVELLKSLGAKYAFDLTEKEFEKELGEACKKLAPGVCFDPVGGSLLGKVLNAMPPKATAYVFGALEMPVLNGISSMGLMFKDLTIKGFQMSQAEFAHDYKKLRERFEYVLDDIRKGGKGFLTVVAKKVKMEKCKEAIGEFKALAGKGKIIFQPNA